MRTYEQKVGWALEQWVRHCRLDSEDAERRPSLRRGSTAQKMLWETVMRLVHEARAETALEILAPGTGPGAKARVGVFVQGDKGGRYDSDGVLVGGKGRPGEGEAEALVESDAEGFEAMGGGEEVGRGRDGGGG